jgi:hypothetical protein
MSRRSTQVYPEWLTVSFLRTSGKQRDRKTIAVLLRVSLMGVNKARNEMLTYCQQYALTPLNHVGARNIETVRALTQAMRGALDYAV